MTTAPICVDGLIDTRGLDGETEPAACHGCPGCPSAAVVVVVAAPPSRVRVHHGSGEEARRDEVMAAVADLARKYDEHRGRSYSHIKVGALAPVVAAYRGTEAQ